MIKTHFWGSDPTASFCHGRTHMSSISRYPRKNVKSKILALIFRFCVGELWTLTCIMLLTFHVESIIRTGINQIIGSSVQINGCSQPCFTGFLVLLSIYHQVNTDNMQNLKFLGDPPHKIWEKHFLIIAHV